MVGHTVDVAWVIALLRLLVLKVKKGPLVSLVTSKPNHNTTDETHGGRVPVVPSVSLLRPVTFGQVEDGGEGRSDDDLLHLGRR